MAQKIVRYIDEDTDVKTLLKVRDYFSKLKGPCAAMVVMLVNVVLRLKGAFDAANQSNLV